MINFRDIGVLGAGVDPNTLTNLQDPTGTNGAVLISESGETWVWNEVTDLWVMMTSGSGADKFHSNIVGTAPYDPLLPLSGWVAPTNPIAGNTVEVKFTDGTVGNYTYDGTVWGLDFAVEPAITPIHTNETQAIPYTGVELPTTLGVNVGDTKTILFDNALVGYTWYGSIWSVDYELTSLDTAVNGLRITNDILHRGSDDITDPKDSELIHNTYNHLNGFTDNWIGNTGNNIYQINPVRDAQNAVTFTRFGDAQINDVYVGRGMGDVASNTVVGSIALRGNTTGADNTAIGLRSSEYNSTGYANTTIGAWAYRVGITGNRNVAIGDFAMYSGGVSRNIAIGSNAMFQAAGSDDCIAIGGSALYNNQASANVAIGGVSLRANTTGYSNTAIGSATLYSNTIGYQNVAIGASSMEANTTGYLNTAIGQISLFKNTTGSQNVGIGAQSLSNNTTGFANTSIGNGSMSGNLTGQLNSTLGFSASGQNNGDNNVTIGASAMSASLTASNQVAIGQNALNSSATGFQNVGVGRLSLANLKNAQNNTAIGNQAGVSLQSSILTPFLIAGNSYTITNVGTTDFTLVGAASNTVGVTFTATGTTIGTGEVSSNEVSDYNTLVGAEVGGTLNEGQNNTIIGARVQAGSGNNRVMLGDGEGNVRYQSDANGANFLNGSVKISDSTTAPTPGTLRYNTATDKFQGFTLGSGWVDLH